MNARAATAALAGLRPSFARRWERISVFLPAILMALIALGTYWLARNTPIAAPAAEPRAPTHDPDYFMRQFSVKTFDPGGRLKSEVAGAEGRHFPDTDTLEVDEPRIRAYNLRGELTIASARKALSNGDGSQVQLIGDAVVVSEAVKDAQGNLRPRMEFRGEFLHAFLDTERIRSHKPVTLIRGTDRFSADSLDFDNLDRTMDLRGRVRGVLTPQAAP